MESPEIGFYNFYEDISNEAERYILHTIIHIQFHEFIYLLIIQSLFSSHKVIHAQIFFFQSINLMFFTKITKITTAK